MPASTVSRSLTRLEKYLGVLLARRSSRGLVLTDAGREYRQTCRRALRTLRDGSGLIESQRSQPRGLLKIACPITMARDLLAPLLQEFLRRFPDLRVEIEPYASGWDQEPREDVDVFFKLRAPKDSLRRVRPYPGTARGLFASPGYVQASGSPSTPENLAAHRCIGSGVWKLTRGKSIATPDIAFCVVTSDPHIHLALALRGLGISILPLWMAKCRRFAISLSPSCRSGNRSRLRCALCFQASPASPPKCKSCWTSSRNSSEPIGIHACGKNGRRTTLLLSRFRQPPDRDDRSEIAHRLRVFIPT